MRTRVVPHGAPGEAPKYTLAGKQTLRPCCQNHFSPLVLASDEPGRGASGTAAAAATAVAAAPAVAAPALGAPALGAPALGLVFAHVGVGDVPRLLAGHCIGADHNPARPGDVRAPHPVAFVCAASVV